MRTIHNTPELLVNFPQLINEIFNHPNQKYKPQANIVKSDNEYRIELLVPGYNKDAIKVEVENNVLSISGEISESNEKSEENYVVKSFATQNFNRMFTLPENEIDEDQITADYSNGILNIKLPKKEIAKAKGAKTIAINA